MWKTTASAQFQVPTQHLPQMPEENQKKISDRITGLQVLKPEPPEYEIRIT